MKGLLAILVALSVVVTPQRLNIRVAPTTTTGGGTNYLIQSTDLTYAGGFRVPTAGTDADSYNYGAGPMAYNPTNNSIYMAGKLESAKVGEISIPALVNSATVGNLNYGTNLQAPTDILVGKRLDIDVGGNTQNGAYIGGLLRYAGGLIVSIYTYYDGGGNQITSHFKTGINFSSLVAGDVTGPYEVTNTLRASPGAGFVFGFMFPILDSAWATLMGGSYITGSGPRAVTGRASWGPTSSVFHPEQFGVTTATSSGLVGYPIAHPNLGHYDSPPGQYYNGAVQYEGAVWPDGTDSVLVFGRIPTSGPNNYCYGAGTATGSPANPPVTEELYGGSYMNGSDASTSNGGLRVTLPNQNVSLLTPTGDWIWLSSQTTPDGFPGAGGHLGMAYVTGTGNSGAANAYIDVSHAYTNGLTGQAYKIGVLSCPDTSNSTKGNHAFPYWSEVLAYDANELYQVKLGNVQPYDVYPYATWSFTTPLTSESGANGGKSVNGVAYDPTTRRIYVSMAAQDGCCTPVIHAWTVR